MRGGASIDSVKLPSPSTVPIMTFSSTEALPTRRGVEVRAMR
jgi:hypothetical protein